jgi:hypothetical protein
MWPGGYGNRGYGQRSDGLGVVTAEGEHFDFVGSARSDGFDAIAASSAVSARAREYRIFLIIFLTLPNLLADPYRGLVAALPIRADQC